MYKRLKDLREDNDFTQKKVADVLKISQQYYSEYEMGKRPIPVSHLISLSKLYKTSIDYIVGLTDVKQAYKGTKIVN